ncbi:MAG: putative bacterial extracellular solute-binding protein, family 5 [Chloroflexi bacterium]|nr:putative bacterial extracellular solute-binding protein, family 5 [Chloroflexota bacterium]
MLKSDPRAPTVGKPFARHSYDPQAALQEFADAGWKRGEDGRMVNVVGEAARIELRGGPVEGTEVALMADSWRQLGIDAAEEIASVTLARDNEYQATFPALALRAYRSNAELFPVFDSRAQSTAQNRWQGLNYSHYVNPALDSLTDMLYATTDERQQGQLLKELGEILATDLPALPAYFRVLMAAVTKDVNALVEDYAGGTGPGSGPGLLSRNAYLWDRR